MENNSCVIVLTVNKSFFKAKIRHNSQVNISPASRLRPSVSVSLESGSVISSEINQNFRSDNKRQEIFRLLCNKIDNWRDFGRCLGMTDVELSRISQDQTLRNDIKLFIQRVLERMEEVHGSQFYEKLHNALIEARRKDVARSIKSLIQKPM